MLFFFSFIACALAFHKTFESSASSDLEKTQNYTNTSQICDAVQTCICNRMQDFHGISWFEEHVQASPCRKAVRELVDSLSLAPTQPLACGSSRSLLKMKETDRNSQPSA